jgi:short-subunit dehydrogenase
LSRPLALVTGASAGIGREIARILAADYDLVLVARRRDRLEALAEELPGTHRVECCDLTAQDDRRALLDRVASLPIEVLVNNAGFGSNGPFCDNDPDSEVGQIELNCVALVDLTRHLLPGMVARGGGHVLQIASIAAFQPGPFVLSFTEALAYELRASPVTITAHCPGATASEFGAIAGNGSAKLFTHGPVDDPAAVAADAVAAMKRADPVRVFGLRNRVNASLVRFVPRGLLLPLVATLNRP